MKNFNKIIKFLSVLLIVTLLFMTTGCINDEKVTVIVPTGTPSLGVSKALKENSLVDANIVSGSDPLIAAFTNANYDIIVAPVNLGAKFYNTTEGFDYVLYKTIVWGNYYLASTSEIDSFESLEGKTLLVFGKNSTPDVVVRTLIASKGLNVKLEYVDDVATANSYLVTGKAEVIVSAEPSLTKLSLNKQIYTYDLQEEWKMLTGSYSLPQAGIFVKASKKDYANVKKVLEKMTASVKEASTNPDALVDDAVSIDSNLNTIGAEVLKKAILRCNLRVEEFDKDAVNFYFSKVIELGIGATVGGKLPDEGFFY